jgi:hypothetical protein
MTLNEHFPGLMQVLGSGTTRDSNSSSDLNASSRAADVNLKVLEAAANDFSHYYKQKAEQIAREV